MRGRLNSNRRGSEHAVLDWNREMSGVTNLVFIAVSGVCSHEANLERDGG